MKKIKRKYIYYIIIIFLIITLILTLFLRKDLNAPVDLTDNEQITFEVKEGNDANTVSQELYELGLIQDENYFYNLFLENSGVLYANTYAISKAMTSEEIYNIITSPTSNIDVSNMKTLLIYEGEDSSQVAQEIAEILNISEEEVLDYWSNTNNLNEWIDEYSVLTDEILDDQIICPLEGYLYPATYVIDDDETLEKLTNKILKNTEAQYSKYMDETFLENFTFHQILTLASIVERETMLDDDRPKVAQVFYNRIDNNMNLESDITVLYALGEYKQTVLYEDLEYDSPYNTYLYSGLPPSPISSVSNEALEATINPEPSDNLYFFAKQDTGKIIFSKTLEEHEAVAEKYAWED